MWFNFRCLIFTARHYFFIYFLARQFFNICLLLHETMVGTNLENNFSQVPKTSVMTLPEGNANIAGMRVPVEASQHANTAGMRVPVDVSQHDMFSPNVTNISGTRVPEGVSPKDSSQTKDITNTAGMRVPVDVVTS